MPFKVEKCLICACCMLSIINVITAAPTSEKPPGTSGPPDVVATTESHTASVVSLDQTKLHEAEIISYTVSMYAGDHFDEMIRSYHLTSESNEIESTVLEGMIRPSLPANILEQTNSCTNIKGILDSILALVKDNIQLSEGIAKSRHKQIDNSTIMALKSLSDKISEMLNIQGDQPSSRYTTAEVDKLARDLIQVLATEAHIEHEMDTCRAVFKTLRTCIK